MHHQPTAQHLHPLPHPDRHEILHPAPGPFQIQPHHIRLDGETQPTAPPHPHVRHPSRPVVTGAQLPPRPTHAGAESLVDAHAGRGADDARLAHAAADAFPHPSGALDEGGVADEDAADRGAEALAEAEADAVEAGAVVVERGPAGRDGLPEAGAVEVGADAVVAGPGGDGAGVGEREEGAVEGVLEADDAGGAGVDVVGQDGVALHVGQGQVVAVLRHDAGDEGAGQGGDAAGFVG